jgi:hypothetical protein
VPRHLWRGTTLAPLADLRKEALDGSTGDTECPMVHDFQYAYKTERFACVIAQLRATVGP